MSRPLVTIESGRQDVYWWSCSACGVAGVPHTVRDDVDIDRIRHEAQHARYVRLLDDAQRLRTVESAARELIGLDGLPMDAGDATWDAWSRLQDLLMDGDTDD